MDLLIGTGRLVSELVAGDVQDLQTLIVVFLIHGLQRLVVRRKATTGRRI